MKNHYTASGVEFRIDAYSGEAEHPFRPNVNTWISQRITAMVF